MKKTLLFVLALIAVGCAEPIPRNLDDLVQQGEVYLDRETMRAYSGPVFQLFSDDTTTIQSAFTLRDGKRGEHGTDETYYENGQLRVKEIYVAGELDGPFESYYENGQLRFKGTYVAGEQDGPVESYHENGQLRSKRTYAAGELDGPAEFYHENGNLQFKGTYVAGERDGLHEAYYENGQLDRKLTYVAGQLHGLREVYLENGQLFVGGTYDMGEKCGEWLESLGPPRTDRNVTYPPCPPGLEDGN